MTISEEQKAIFRETCKTFVHNGGICIDIDCKDCPFSQRYNKGVDCIDNGYTIEETCAQDTVLVESAKQWLKDNPEHDTKLMEKEGAKYDSGKPDWSLLPLDEIEQVVDVLTFGAVKYDRDNWKKVDNKRDRYFAAMMRHIKAWFTGETHDQESGKHHLAHAICCALFLMWNDNVNKELRK